MPVSQQILERPEGTVHLENTPKSSRPVTECETLTADLHGHRKWRDCAGADGGLIGLIGLIVALGSAAVPLLATRRR